MGTLGHKPLMLAPNQHVEEGEFHGKHILLLNKGGQDAQPSAELAQIDAKKGTTRHIKARQAQKGTKRHTKARTAWSISER